MEALLKQVENAEDFRIFRHQSSAVVSSSEEQTCSMPRHKLSAPSAKFSLKIPIYSMLNYSS